MQELQERVNLMNDSGKLQDVESACSGRLSHLPSQQTIVPNPRGVLGRDQSLRLDTWNLLGSSENVFDIHSIDTFLRHPPSLEILMLQMETPCVRARGDL